jgi:hypothetical protein
MIPSIGVPPCHAHNMGPGEHPAMSGLTGLIYDSNVRCWCRPGTSSYQASFWRRTWFYSYLSPEPLARDCNSYASTFRLSPPWAWRLRWISPDHFIGIRLERNPSRYWRTEPILRGDLNELPPVLGRLTWWVCNASFSIENPNDQFRSFYNVFINRRTLLILYSLWRFCYAFLFGALLPTAAASLTRTITIHIRH